VPPPIIASGFLPQAVKLAAELGDGYWGNAPDRDLIEQFENNGGGYRATRSSTGESPTTGH
jgi:hypothetical protein